MTKDERAKLIDETLDQLDIVVMYMDPVDFKKARTVLEAFADKLTAEAVPIIQAVADLGSCDLEPDKC
jgi:hypothetical protein